MIAVRKLKLTFGNCVSKLINAIYNNFSYKDFTYLNHRQTKSHMQKETHLSIFLLSSSVLIPIPVD